MLLTVLLWIFKAELFTTNKSIGAAGVVLLIVVLVVLIERSSISQGRRFNYYIILCAVQYLDLNITYFDALGVPLGMLVFVYIAGMIPMLERRITIIIPMAAIIMYFIFYYIGGGTTVRVDEPYYFLSIAFVVVVLLSSRMLNSYFREIADRLRVGLDETQQDKQKLLEVNTELHAMYQQIAATDEELKAQYDELEEGYVQLQSSESRYKMIFDASNEGLWDYDMATGKKFFSVEWYQNYGFDWGDDEALLRWAEKVHPEDAAEAFYSYQKVKNGETDSDECEYRYQMPNGDYRWVGAKCIALRNAEGNILRMAGSHSDIHEKKKQQERILALAYTDPLTGLSNRNHFFEQFERIMHSCGREACMGAILYLDVDNFKHINDTFGHFFGDRVIEELAKRIKALPHKFELASRLGGDMSFIAPIWVKLWQSGFSLDTVCTARLKKESCT